MGAMLTVLIASPFPAMRAGLQALLAAEPGPTASAELGLAGSLAECLDRARAERPEVIVYDLALEAADEADGLWGLRREAPGCAILALADPGQPARMIAALRAGARGCLLKEAGGAELAEAIIDLAAGSAGRPAGPAAPAQAAPALSPREADVLRGVAAGQTNKAIALSLGISEHTVKFHLGGAMAKLGAASRAEAVASALRLGRISL